jgi:aminopeptidase
LNALTRFCATRGRPKRLVSDNQTSFKSSSKELKSFYAYFKDKFKQIEGVLNSQGEPIEWAFITPRSPHHGGAWEIMVKAMKRALVALSKGQTMNEDTFNTYLCLAMNMINNRPLTKHYSQDSPHYLTPNDFIIGRQDSSLVPSTEEVPSSRLGNRWRQLETLGNQLWHRFVNEILPELAPRQKWKSLFDNLKEGTLVLVVEPGLPRGVWKTGLVVKVELGRDGLARSAVVKIGAREYDRPVTRLIPLI